MSNLSKQEDNLPAKRKNTTAIILGVAGNYATKAVEKFVEALPYIMSYIAGQFAWVGGLEWYWIALIALGVLFVTSFILRTVFFVKDRRKQSQIETNESADTNDLSISPKEIEEKETQESLTIETLKNDLSATRTKHFNEKKEIEIEYLEEIENLKKGCQEEKETLTTTIDNLQNQIKSLKDEQEKYSLVNRRFNKHINNIDQFVILPPQEVIFRLSSHSHHLIPVIKGELKFENNSYCEVVFESVSQGEVLFQGKPLFGARLETGPYSEEKKINTLILISGFNEKLKDIKNTLLESVSQDDFALDISNLKIKIKGNENFPEVLPKDLKIGKDVIARFDVSSMLSKT